MLCNAACFTFNDFDIGLPQGIDQGRFTVIDMPENCNNWRTGYQIFWSVFLFDNFGD